MLAQSLLASLLVGFTLASGNATTLHNRSLDNGLGLNPNNLRAGHIYIGKQLSSADVGPHRIVNALSCTASGFAPGWQVPLAVLCFSSSVLA